jgi:hypothetical protein
MITQILNCRNESVRMHMTDFLFLTTDIQNLNVRYHRSPYYLYEKCTIKGFTSCYVLD